jgi:hypothetical protein
MIALKVLHRLKKVKGCKKYFFFFTYSKKEAEGE